MFKRELKIDSYLFIILLIGVVFFCLYSFLAFSFPNSFNGQPKLIFNSPDETSNYYYSQLFAVESTFKYQDSANQFADGLVSPRSLRVIDGQTVPAGFMGLPLIFGSLAKLLGICAIVFFTPLMAFLGIIFFFLLIKELFNRQIALISSLLAFILPAYWYYATKSMMPNIAFVAFLIMALYFLIKIIKGKNLVNYIFLGIFLSLTLMIRTSEVIWIGLLILILIIINYKKIKWSYLLISFIIFLIVFSPIFYFNQQIYSSPLSLGYSLDFDLEGKNLVGQGLTLAQKIILPFGFQPRLALRNLNNYSFGLFPIWSYLVLFSLLFFGFSAFFKKQRTHFIYLLLYLFLGGYLIIYYGSWLFHDHPDPSAVTIGTSYVRYWLPLYLFSLPFLSYALTTLFKRFKIGFPVVISSLLTVLVISSYQLVMLDKEEGIYQVKRNIQQYQQIASTVIKGTEKDSIIISERMDKVFFPTRRVIYKLNHPKDYQNVKKLIKADYPVYYFYFTRSKEELNKFNSKYFKEFGLQIAPSIMDFKEQSLYPIKLIEF